MEVTKQAGDLQRITEIICKALNPESILLFGTHAGGAPHSELPAYDLLVITNGEPRYDWQQTNHYLKLHIPVKYREISYLNLYVYSQKFIENNASLFFYNVKSEGQLLYSRESRLLTKVRRPSNYLTIYQTTLKSYSILFNSGSKLLNDSNRAFSENNFRPSVFYLSHAVETFYKAIFVVYHNFEVSERDIRVLHQRLRTLSSDLILLFDSDQNKNGQILSRLNQFRKSSLFDIDFDISKDELSNYLEYITQMKEIVEIIYMKKLENRLN